VVRLHALSYRAEDDEWIVGRESTGDFVALPAVAVAFLRALEEGETVAEAKKHADLAYAEDIDAADFVATLLDLGFVAAVDGQRVEEPPARPPNLRWLKPRHVAWVFRWPVVCGIGAIIVAGLAVSAFRTGFPSYQGFFVTQSPGLDILISVAAFIPLVALHEFWHLAAARAAGIDAWFGLSTRLVFLVAQTAVPGLWLAERRIRIRVYLAGMSFDLLSFSALSFAEALTPSTGATHAALSEFRLFLLLGVAEQFAFYMRTDVYYVIQELTRCKNLYGDAMDYLRYRSHRLFEDPTISLPPHERRPVRAYAALVLAGSTLTLVFFAGYELPIAVTGIRAAVAEISAGVRTVSVAHVADGTAFILVTAMFQALFIRAFWRKHGHRLPASFRRRGRAAAAEAAPVSD
jgi:putative peptide zinc metalloprotease protein